MRTTHEGPLLVNVKLADVERLEQMFAKRTEQGWVIPGWLRALRAVAK